MRSGAEKTPRRQDAKTPRWGMLISWLRVGGVAVMFPLILATVLPAGTWIASWPISMLDTTSTSGAFLSVVIRGLLVIPLLIVVQGFWIILMLREVHQLCKHFKNHPTNNQAEAASHA